MKTGIIKQSTLELPYNEHLYNEFLYITIVCEMLHTHA